MDTRKISLHMTVVQQKRNHWCYLGSIQNLEEMVTPQPNRSGG